jgi:hypothetical protein
MNQEYIISKMNQYLHKSTIVLSEWLSLKLPRVSDSWWTECVLDNLSHYQRERIAEQNIKSLQALDLAALIRVTDKSWFELRSVFYLTQDERECLREMRSVRNKWAHCAGNIPDKEIIEQELGVILQFAEIYGAGAEIREDIRSFQKELSCACLIPQESMVSAQSYKTEEKITTPTITEKSIVFLKSDPTVKGMVFSIGKIDGTVKYEVFVNGEIKTFYADQVLPDNPVLFYNIVDIRTLQSSLSAYQLKNPIMDSLYSLNAARIDFVPYQFRPALKIIKSDVPRLLIADSVGVGKTIEAGLILKELQARSDIERVLVICPKPLVAERKWELEMKRFDEEFIPVDGPTLRRIISDTYRDGIWPERYNKAIIPYSLLSNDLLYGSDAGNGMRNSINPGLLDLDPAPHFDMIIVDGASFIYLPYDSFRYVFRMPYAGLNTYPEGQIMDGVITFEWKNKQGETFRQVIMQVGSTTAYVNGVQVDIKAEPFVKEEETYIPVNLFIQLFEMKSQMFLGRLCFQTEEDFPRDILTGSWSSSHVNLFSRYKDIVSGVESMPSFYWFIALNEDGSYSLFIASSGGLFKDKMYFEKGKYKVIGNVIVYYDRYETLYEGKPLMLQYENRHMGDRLEFDFIEGYDAEEDKIKMRTSWYYRVND